MKMTAAARAAMHEMLTLPLSAQDHLTIDPNGVVWIYSRDVPRTQACFFHTTWAKLSPAHYRAEWHSMEVNVIHEGTL